MDKESLEKRLFELALSASQLYREAWYVKELPYQDRLDLACEGLEVEKAIAKFDALLNRV
jgi:hypothetical protein